MIDGAKEFLSKLNKREKELLKEILLTSYPQLFKEIKSKDYRNKKVIIEQINTFKGIYKKSNDIKIKEIINSLFVELEEVNNRIKNIKEALK